MSKPVLSVPGIDPARIKCMEDGGDQWVHLDGECIAKNGDHGPWFDGRWIRGYAFKRDAQKIMNAAFDHWRATGRLFPEPPPEPVECVCGGKGKLRIDGEFVFCSELRCKWCAPDVASWNLAMAALKAAKEGKS